MRNYFRSGLELKFFDDEVVDQLHEAHAWARRKPGAALFRPCVVDGPWNGAPLVGHRPFAEINADLKAAMELGDVSATIARALEHEAYTARFES